MACNHDCEHCASNGGCGDQPNAHERVHIPPPNNHIKKIIGIVSGKGGVGKSLVTGLLASAMNKKGNISAILDADITGPSIPKLFNVHGMLKSDGLYMFPAESKNGIKIVSMNLCLPNENDPVVWRGPVLAGVVQQFWDETEWDNVDYMFVDMPPGTGDVPLTVFQTLPVDGIVIVTTPQELVSMIVNKALKMAELMKIPVLGIVENMSYFECPNCKTKHYIYGESHVEKTGIKTISRLPIDPKIAELCDAGQLEDYDAGKFLEEIITKIEEV